MKQAEIVYALNEIADLLNDDSRREEFFNRLSEDKNYRREFISVLRFSSSAIQTLALRSKDSE